MKKRGAIEISFGMIFSIILIIAFISVAVYAIYIFLGIKKCADTGMFKQELETEIERAWNSEETSVNFSSAVPRKIEKVCFVGLNAGEKGRYKEQYKELKKLGLRNLNMFFSPIKNACERQKGFNLAHLDIEKITEKDNPYCIENTGEISIRIEKGFYDALVNLS